MRSDPTQKLQEDTLLSAYVFIISDAVSGQLEDDLACRDRLRTTDEYVAGMRSAAAKLKESGTGE